MTERNQESRTSVAGVRVTPSEKLRIEWVAGMKGTDVSNLLRVMSVADVMAEHERLVRAVESAA